MTAVTRDLAYTAVEKPDNTSTTMGSWQVAGELDESPVKTGVPSDYFVFQKFDRPYRLGQYSFWLGLLVGFLAAGLVAVLTNMVRIVTGRADFFDPSGK